MIIHPSERLAGVQEYYFSRKLQQLKNMEAKGKSIINLGIGNPDMHPSEDVLNALSSSARHPKSHGYQPYRGTIELRKAIAEFYRNTYGVSLNPENEILPLLGSKEGITHISLAFLNENDAALVPDPGYPSYSSVTKMTGGKVIAYNLLKKNNWQPDYNELQTVLQQNVSRVKLLWLNYPNMPTGASAGNGCFEKYISFAQKNKILLCHDNPYSLILNNRKPKSILQYAGAKEVAVELNSLSKSHNMAGWRVGWVAGKKEYIDTILKVKSNIDSGMFLPVQKAAVKALAQSDAWHQKRNKEYAARRKRVWKLLDLIRCRYSKIQSGLFVWAEIPRNQKSSVKFVEELLQKTNVFIAPGIIFGKNGEGYVRISLCADTKVLDETIQRIKQIL